MKKNVIAYIHTHWDREWYREFEEFRLRLVEVVDRIIEALQSGEIPVFYFDGQTAAVEDYLEIYPERIDIIKKLIADKKLYIGPFYCSSDSLLTSAESMIRNFKFGIEKSNELGCSDFIGYLSDTFGHSSCVPQVLKSLDIDKIMLWRGVGDLPADLSWDGVKAINLVQGYFQDFLNLDLPIEKKAELLKKYLDKIAKKSGDNILLPIGADHLTIAENLAEQLEKINEILTDYNIKIATPFEYFQAVEKNLRKPVNGEFLDNSLTFILPGVYSSRTCLKQQNTRIEWTLSRVAEPLHALSSFAFENKTMQNQIDYAYKTLIKNHAHDSIYGCSLDSVHDEMMTRFKKVDTVISGVTKRAIRDLSDDSQELAIINLSNFDYSGMVRIETHKKLDKKYNAILISKHRGFLDAKLYNPNEIPVTEDYTNIFEYLIEVKNIPSFSLTKISQEYIVSDCFLDSGVDFIENDMIKISVKNGKINLYDKALNKEYKDFLSFKDRADIGDSYNFGALMGDKPLYSRLKSYKISNKKKFMTIDFVYEIKIPKKSNSDGRSKKLALHRIKFSATLYNNADFIEWNLNFINKSENHIMQVVFNLDTPVIHTVSEDMVGVIERDFDYDYDIYKKIPAPRGIELKTNTAPMQRFVWANGLGIVTEGIREYEIEKNTFAITLLRATGIISEPKNTTRGTPAGPPIPANSLQAEGLIAGSFITSFKHNPLELYPLAEAFYCPIITVFGCKEDLKFFETDNKNILLYACKMSGNNLILRFANITDTKQKLNLKVNISHSKLIETNSLEEEKGSCSNIIEFSPKEIKSIKILR